MLLLFQGLVLPLASVNAYAGESSWRQNPDDTVTVFFVGNSSDVINLHWSVVEKPGHWLNATDTPMTYGSSSQRQRKRTQKPYIISQGGDDNLGDSVYRMLRNQLPYGLEDELLVV